MRSFDEHSPDSAMLLRISVRTLVSEQSAWVTDGEEGLTNTPHDRRPSLRWTGVCIDCGDAEELAGFYRRLLGYEESSRDGAGLDPVA